MGRAAILLGVALGLAAVGARAAVPDDVRMKGPFLIASTPYLADGAVDFDALVTEARYLDAAGCTGVIWPQSNDSIDLLTPAEKREGLRRLVVAAASFTNAVPPFARMPALRRASSLSNETSTSAVPSWMMGEATDAPKRTWLVTEPPRWAMPWISDFLTS